MKWIKRGAMLVVGLAIIGAIAWGFAPKPIAVDMADAMAKSILITIDEEGMTRVKDRFTVMVPSAGTIARIALKPGDSVLDGTPITVLRPVRPVMLDARQLTEARAGIRAAEASAQQMKAAARASQAEHKFAGNEHDRLRRLLASKHVAKEQVDAAATRETAARAAFESAQFAEQAAQFQLEMARAVLLTSNDEASVTHLTITAPVDGKILRVLREDEGTVQAGDALLEIGNPDALEVVVDLLSRDAVRIAKGNKVYIERWGGDDSLQGIVRTVEPHGFTKISALGVEEQRVKVIIDFTGPKESWRRLGDGYRAETRIVVTQTEQVLTVPSSALFTDRGKRAVFMIRDGKAVLQHVTVGANNGLDAEIIEGLDDKAQVIIHPSDEIADGVAVVSR
jgi:HlyD family secretion protein